MSYLAKILKEDEEAVRVVRRAPWSFLFKIIWAAVLIALPFFLMYPLFRWQTWGLPILGLLLTIGLVYGLRVFVVWYFNVLVITDRRVIDVYQRGFFDRTVSAAGYSRIRDAAYRVKGLLPTIFRYGTVIIEIAGAKVRLEVKNVKNPKEIQEIIVALAKNSQDSARQDEFQRLVGELRAQAGGVDIPVRVADEK